MTLLKTDIKRYQKIFSSKYNEEISKEKAIEELTALVNLTKSILFSNENNNA